MNTFTLHSKSLAKDDFKIVKIRVVNERMQSSVNDAEVENGITTVWNVEIE